MRSLCFRRRGTGTVSQACALWSLRLALLFSGFFCCLPSLFSQTSDLTPDQFSSSSIAITDLKNDSLFSTHIPVRIVEKHTQSGDRTLDERSIEVKGDDGHLKTYQEIEKETLQVDSDRARITTRTFGRNVNGAKSLIQVTEEEKHVLPSGDSTVVRVTSNPDVNGKLQPVQREVVEARKTDKDTNETNTTVLLPNINGGLAPAFKTHELTKGRADGTTEIRKDTLLADGAGKWELSEIRRTTISTEGANRTTDERVFRRDSAGQLIEISRVVSKQPNSDSGEKGTIVDAYSIDVPGAARDGHLHLVERATTTQETSTTGERVTQKSVEQVDPANPGSGLGVCLLMNDKMVPVSSGAQSMMTIRVRDSNGTFSTVFVDTRKSDWTPTVKFQEAPSSHSR